MKTVKCKKCKKKETEMVFNIDHPEEVLYVCDDCKHEIIREWFKNELQN